MSVKWVETREIPLAEVAPFPGNAHTGDPDAIRASLRRHGQYRSLIIRQQDDGTLVILAGNNVAAALQAEGTTTARCDVITCTDAEATRINVADNRLAALGDDNPALLLRALNSLAGDLDGSGFADQEVDALRAALEAAAEPRPPLVVGSSASDDYEYDPVFPAPPPTPAGPARDYGPVPDPDRPPGAPGQYQQPPLVGVSEVILVVSQEQRDEYVALIAAARERDGDQTAAKITLAALRGHAAAVG